MEPDSKSILFMSHIRWSFSDLLRPMCSHDFLLMQTKQPMTLAVNHVTWGGTFARCCGPLTWKPWDFSYSSPGSSRGWTEAMGVSGGGGDDWRWWGRVETACTKSGLFHSHRRWILSRMMIKIKVPTHTPSLYYFPSKQYILPNMKGHCDGELFSHLFAIHSLQDLR